MDHCQSNGRGSSSRRGSGNPGRPSGTLNQSRNHSDTTSFEDRSDERNASRRRGYDNSHSFPESPGRGGRGDRGHSGARGFNNDRRGRGDSNRGSGVGGRGGSLSSISPGFDGGRGTGNQRGRPRNTNHANAPRSNSANSVFPRSQYPDAAPVRYAYYTKPESLKVAPIERQNERIYHPSTKSLGTAQVSVIANYVHVANVPDQLFVYSVTNFTPRPAK
jgi:hypothetical protein